MEGLESRRDESILKARQRILDTNDQNLITFVAEFEKLVEQIKSDPQLSGIVKSAVTIMCKNKIEEQKHKNK